MGGGMAIKPVLKLYVWEGVLTDYSDGMMVALAPNLAEARKLLKEKCAYIPEGDLEKEPKEVCRPEGFIVWGGP